VALTSDHADYRTATPNSPSKTTAVDGRRNSAQSRPACVGGYEDRAAHL